ncbi:MAG TPA: PRC-barrel domain-containing protein [Hyphomonadaceae bacterium]|nr:PRC-barrel domain-containing protein [Hyphomonadaceae bacterium]
MPSTGRGQRGRREGESVRFTPFAAYRFRNREVFSPAGESGRVRNVLLGDDGRHYAIVDFGADLGVHQVPVSSIAYEDGKFVANEADIGGLPGFVEGQAGLSSLDPEAAISIPGYRLQETEDSTILVQNASPQVTVQRPALQINWEQAPPQITVHQPTPHVNVRQLQPVIIVRQPPPRVTIEFDQPEIIVRMPDPEVDVTIAEPDVQISMPKPRVEVLQTEQPQVRITAGEPLVSLEPRREASVEVQRSQPQVRYERIGEPQFSFRELNGGPRVTYEQMSHEDAVRAESEVASRTMSSAQLRGMKIFGRDGNEAGTVSRVAIGDGKLSVILETGGFFGLAARKIALPMASLDLRDGRLFVRNLTAMEIGKIEAREEDIAKYIPTTDDRKVYVGPTV